MEAFLVEVEWVPTLVGAVVAFGLGALWYSPYMFVKGWLAGIGEPVWRAPMWMPMSAQAGATLFYAMFANVALGQGHIVQFVLVTLLLAGFIKSNGLYCGKTKYAITVEVGYIIAMGLVLYGVNVVL